MLTTVEDKLSAIKAINEEKETVERKTSALVRFAEQSSDIRIQIISSRETAAFDLPAKLNELIISAIYENLGTRKTELIAKAEELMK